MGSLVPGAMADLLIDPGSETANASREAVARLIHDRPAGRSELKADWIETPLGPMLAVADAAALHLLEFHDRDSLPAELTRLRATITFGRLSPIDAIERELDQYFGNAPIAFATPLARRAPAFTLSVWDVLLAIPSGETRSYGQIAVAIGRPSAVRAVARANAANPVAIVVPCHRVIGSDGALTGYGGRLWRKRWLIDHEARRSPIS